MHLRGAEAIGDAAHRNSVAEPVGGVAGQRVVALPAGCGEDVDVCAGGPPGQGLLVGAGQGDHADAVGCGDALGDIEAQVEADAQLRSREHLDRAHEKAQRIIDSVSKHASDVLRDAEDRTRHLRWQQHQLGSFMAEVREMIRPEGSRSAAELESADASLDNAPAEPETADDDQARVTESPAYD